MSEPGLPPPTVRLLDDRGQPTPEFWRLLRDAARIVRAGRVAAKARNSHVMWVMFGDEPPSLEARPGADDGDER
jgi:hypothetical protein